MYQHQPCAGSPESAQGGRPALDLADIVRAFRPAYEQQRTLTVSEGAVLDAVTRCRTAALGGHVNECLQCGFVSEPSYNSCHDRHCPKCPAVAQARWIAGRLERVLPPTAQSAVPNAPEPSPSVNLRTAKWREVIRVLTGIDLDTCPRCGARQLARRPLSYAPTIARAPPSAA